VQNHVAEKLKNKKNFDELKNSTIFDELAMFASVENPSWPRARLHDSKPVCTVRLV